MTLRGGYQHRLNDRLILILFASLYFVISSILIFMLCTSHLVPLQNLFESFSKAFPLEEIKLIFTR